MLKMLDAIKLPVEAIRLSWEVKANSFRGSIKFHRDQPVIERIFDVMLGSSCKKARQYLRENVIYANQLKDVISYCVEKEIPIPVAITFALYMRSKNHFKFFEGEKNVPHLGWADFLGEFKYLHDKVKFVYPPGIKLFIFEEASLLYPILNWKVEDVDRFEAITLKIIQVMQMSEMIVIIPMGEMDFPSLHYWNRDVSFDELKNHPIDDSVVFAMMTSCEDCQDMAIMDLLYNRRERDYASIKEKHSFLWMQAHFKAAYVRHVMDIRKQHNCWGKIIQDHYLQKGVEILEHGFVDAVITFKNGRLALNVGNLLPNHGMLVVGAKGRCIMPEYRIRKEFQHAEPIKINDGVEEFTFFYKA
jgi:hypothetical protein